MKKNLQIIVIALCLSFSYCIGQTYHPFETDSATWTSCVYTYGPLPGGPTITSVSHYGLSGDTIINSFAYSKIYVNPNPSSSQINPVPNFDRSTALYYGAFREDASKKIWKRGLLDTADILYYDFALNLGDTFCFSSLQSNGTSCIPVSMVDSILVNGAYRRQIHFNINGLGAQSWIEGIGGTVQNWEGIWNGITNFYYELNCYKEKGVTIYGACNYPTNIHQIFKNQLTVTLSPNPFADRLDIKLNTNEPSEIIIYDVTSRKLSQKQFITATTLNTDQLQKGIYHYEVKTKNGLSNKGKLVKQ
jgi:hypothetical protein